MFVQNATEVCRIAISRRSDCGGDPQRDASRKKGRGGGGQGAMRIYPDPLYYQEGQLLGVGPAETINTKVSGKVSSVCLTYFRSVFLLIKSRKKRKKNCHLQDDEEFFYDPSSRCHAMRIQHQYANFSRILQF